MNEQLDKAIGMVRKRVAAAVLLGDGLRVLAMLLAPVGVAVLVARRFGGAGQVQSLKFFALMALVPLVAWLLARRRMIDKSTAAVWLDKASGGAGRITAQVEQGDGPWSSGIAADLARVPGLPGMRLKQPILWALGALVFAGATFFVPVRQAQAVRVADRLTASVLDELEQKLDVLEEVNADEELLEQLREDLRALRAEQKKGADSLEGRFEALDSVEARMQSAAEDMASTRLSNCRK